MAGGQEQSRQFGLGAQQFGQGAQAFGLGEQQRGQQIGEQAYLRQLPLNEMNALRTGAQVGMPQFQPYASANVTPAPIMQGAMAQGQADQNLYNAQQAQGGQFMGGLMQLGGAISGARPWWLP